MEKSGDIAELLGIMQLPDAYKTGGGWLAVRRPDIAPMAYEMQVNNPVARDTMRKLIEFAGEACPGMVQRLYELCNGLNVGPGSGKFAVYGVISDRIDRSITGEPRHAPFDINVPNLYGRPSGWPESCLIVGLSWDGDRSIESGKVHHAITSDCRIVVGVENGFSQPLRSYSKVEEWLKHEVQLVFSKAQRQ